MTNEFAKGSVRREGFVITVLAGSAQTILSLPELLKDADHIEFSPFLDNLS